MTLNTENPDNINQGPSSPALVDINSFMDVQVHDFVKLLLSEVHPSFHQQAWTLFCLRVDYHWRHYHALAYGHTPGDASGDASIHPGH